MITVCPSDEELLAVASGDPPTSDLESHLRECKRCVKKVDGLRLEVKELQKIFHSTENDPIQSPVPRQTAPQIKVQEAAGSEPKRIGKYLVVGTLGGGGQANVYRAVHPTLDEQVVLKLSSRKLSDSDPVVDDRLISEGKILCQLKHPHIGRIYDLDFFEHRAFLVMEFVRGRSLDQYVRDRQLPWQQIVTLSAKVARALDAAHRVGIVHQDVKPQNIVINEADEPKLIDFGMARLNGTSSDERAQPLGGTINYMASEQAKAETKHITGRSDVFALGAVMYFLTTRKPPFAAPTRDESLARARDCNFDRTALEQAEIPPKLKQIVFKAMTANPEGRFATAGEMAEALESLDRGTRRTRTVIRSIPLFLLILVGLIAWIAWPGPVALPPDGQLLITPDGSNSLQLPLYTESKIRIEGQVPREPTVAFWIGPSGKVDRVELTQVHGSGQFDHFYCPGLQTISGAPGTEFLLIISGKHLDDPAKVDELQRQLESFFAHHSLADLPQSDAIVVLGLGGAHPEYINGDPPRDLGPSVADPFADVTGPLNSLGQTLKDQGYFLAGIAVPHSAKSGDSQSQ